MSPRRRSLEAEARYVLDIDPSIASQISELTVATAKKLGLIAKPRVERRDTDCYYDDTRMSLRSRGLALRIRSGDDLEPTLALKREHGHEENLHVRSEFEGTLDHATILDLVSTLRESGLDLEFDECREIEDWQDVVAGLRLRPVAVLNQVRQKFAFVRDTEPHAELSLDRICYLWPVASLGPTILEMECYSKLGTRFAAALERRLAEKWPGLLTHTFLSKKEIGIGWQIPRRGCSNASENPRARD